MLSSPPKQHIQATHFSTLISITLPSVSRYHNHDTRISLQNIEPNDTIYPSPQTAHRYPQQEQQKTKTHEHNKAQRSNAITTSTNSPVGVKTEIEVEIEGTLHPVLSDSNKDTCRRDNASQLVAMSIARDACHRKL
jgi:hypothetical protein